MSSLAFLYGYKIYENSNMLIFEEYWTKKQTRKFKNRRWNKKYRKKYCKTVSYPDTNVIIDKINNRIYGHPATLQELKEKLLRQEIRKHSKVPESFINTSYYGIFHSPGLSQTVNTCTS
jgi:hypothetical protein